MRRYSRIRRRRRRFSRFRKFFLIAVVITVLFGACTERRLPLVKEELQQAALRSYAQEVIAETVPAYLEGISAAVEGDLTVPDTYTMSRVKSELVCELQEKLCGKTTAWVPFGNLTGLMLLNGHGVKVPVVFSVEGTVSVDFASELTDAGINRTRYAIVMTVTAELHSHSAAMPGSVTVETAYPVYEAVLTGEVPQYISALR